MAKTKIKPHLWLRNGVFYCRIELARFEGKRRYLCYSLYTNDYYDLENTKLYISSGIGTSKYKFRLLNTPSFNFYRLRNK